MKNNQDQEEKIIETLSSERFMSVSEVSALSGIGYYKTKIILEYLASKDFIESEVKHHPIKSMAVYKRKGINRLSTGISEPSRGIIGVKT